MAQDPESGDLHTVLFVKLFNAAFFEISELSNGSKLESTYEIGDFAERLGRRRLQFQTAAIEFVVWFLFSKSLFVAASIGVASSLRTTQTYFGFLWFLFLQTSEQITNREASFKKTYTSNKQQ